MNEIDKVRSQLKDANERKRAADLMRENAVQELQTIDVLIAHVRAALLICEKIAEQTGLFR